MSRLSLLAVFAHPDDEAYGVGGSLSRYAAEGCDVHLVTATRGEAGEISDASLASKANLPMVREQELRCACQVYGIHAPLFLDYLDGQLPGVHQGQAVGKLVRIIRELKPQVLISFGPDGIYGHYDHIAVHRWATIAYDLAADPQCFPELPAVACAPHQVSKLYWSVVSEELVAAMSGAGKPASVLMDGVPFPMVGYPRQQISTRIDVSQHIHLKLQGLQCHATQFSASAASDEEREMLASPLFREELFVLARSTLARAPGLETDLFAGIGAPPDPAGY